MAEETGDTGEHPSPQLMIAEVTLRNIPGRPGERLNVARFIKHDQVFEKTDGGYGLIVRRELDFAVGEMLAELYRDAVGRDLRNRERRIQFMKERPEMTRYMNNIDDIPQELIDKYFGQAE